MSDDFIIPIEDYNVNFVDDFSTLSYKWLQNYTSIVVICDTNTHEHCMPILQPFLPEKNLQIVVDSGEINKNIVTCRYIWSQLMKYRVDRKGLVLLLGGGVIGDMGGFSAASYLRGIDFIHIPTSLLAMTDSSIGGKLGIDMNLVKNMVGLFKNPKSIFIHAPFLLTLPDRELMSGYFEMIKHGLVGDKSLYFSLEQIKPKGRPFLTLDQIRQSILVKKTLVERDPLENNVRRALNFGHTIGHAIESALLKNNTPITHGEAVGMGMIAESYISAQKGLIHQDEFKRIHLFLSSLTHFEYLNDVSTAEIFHFIGHDKKNEMGKINFSLLKGIGGYSINNQVDHLLIEESINLLLKS